MTDTTVKMFIDIFIGIWAFLLAIIWCAKIECKPGEKVQAVEIWHRFPKFVMGRPLYSLVGATDVLPSGTLIQVRNIRKVCLSFTGEADLLSA